MELAGFEAEEAKGIFGRPPKGLNLNLRPWAAGEAQQKFLERFARLAKAAERAQASAPPAAMEARR